MQENTKISAETLVQRNDSILVSTLDDEIVMMDITGGKYFGLDSIGSVIWEHLETPITAADLAARLSETFEVTPADCLKDILPFLAELLEREILLPNSSS